ncbi:hypothetical protein C4556_03660 [Candidatus Parcubacteria bacterium]|nr:MAG: hypothetical protein C4556_03660 [Candidatus Parcubacteria bacterium]
MSLPDKVAIATVSAIAYSRLKRNDRGRIEWASIPYVVTVFFEKKERVQDLGERIRYTLQERGIARKSRDMYASWARLLRKVDELGVPAAENVFDEIPDEELEAAMEHVRRDERYTVLFAPQSEIRFDFFAFRAMVHEVQKRRTPRMKLMLLCGTVVREFVPDTDAPRRLLGQAYKSAFSFLYHKRKEHPSKRVPQPETEHPMAPSPQYRLV